jgi:hypothetical protein
LTIEKEKGGERVRTRLFSMLPINKNCAEEEGDESERRGKTCVHAAHDHRLCLS